MAEENRLKSLEKRMEKADEERANINKDINRIDKEIMEVKVISQKDIKQIFDSLERMEKSSSKTLIRMENIIDRMSEEIENIKLKPAKKWDSAVMLVVTAFLSSAVTYFIKNGGF